MLTSPYARLTVLLDFITTNLGDTSKFKVSTVFNNHTAVTDISQGITFSFVLNDRIYLRNTLNFSRYDLFLPVQLNINIWFWENFKVWEKGINY